MQTRDHAGDGYDYKKGIYARYEITAETAGKMLKVQLKQTEGSFAASPRKIRVGLVCDGKVIYSAWSESDTVVIKSVKDKKASLSASDLKLVKY